MLISIYLYNKLYWIQFNLTEVSNCEIYWMGGIYIVTFILNFSYSVFYIFFYISVGVYEITIASQWLAAIFTNYTLDLQQRGMKETAHIVMTPSHIWSEYLIFQFTIQYNKYE